MPHTTKPVQGKLGILTPGMGSVATTFIAGTLAVQKNISPPIGSLTQMGTIRLGKRTEKRIPLIKDFIPLANLEDLSFGGWDITDENAYEAALKSRVLDSRMLNHLKEELRSIRPMAAVFDQNYVKKLNGSHIKNGKNKQDLADQLRRDIQTFKAENKLDRMVMIWCGSTEKHSEPGPIHQSLDTFEKGLKTNDQCISPSMLYAYAALKEGVPFSNGAPNLTVDIPAFQELAHDTKVPISGKDFKTGQTLLKTVIAPGLKARLLGLSGWYSTNILGNKDGEVLDDPESFKSKEASKLGALDSILQPDMYPELYKDYHHKVRIDYYPPRGDNKEGWDNIDIFGWLGYPMEIKVNFLCRDSILAAPLVLDIALFMDLAKRSGMYGMQEWLSFYYKCPMVAEKHSPEHDLFKQMTKLKNTLRHLMGEDLITPLGLESYYKNEWTAN